MDTQRISNFIYNFLDSVRTTECCNCRHEIEIKIDDDGDEVCSYCANKEMWAISRENADTMARIIAEMADEN